MENKDNITVVDNYNLALPSERIISFLIDYVVSALIYWPFAYTLPWLGGIVSTSYLIFRDCLPFLNYRSVGKKVLKIRVIHGDRKDIDLLTGFKRNIFFLPYLINALGGNYMYAASSVVLLFMIIEVYMIFTTSDSQRLGDSFADTLVIEDAEKGKV